MNLTLPLFDLDDDLPLPAAAPPPGRAGAAPPAPAPAAARAAPLAAAADAALAAAAQAAHDAADAHEAPGLDARLHPAVWRASELGSGAQATSPSGFADLDLQLPGGGWPHGCLTELLLPQPGIGELRLLAPALGAAVPVGRSRCVMVFDPPAALSAWALAQCGLDSRHWLVVQSRPGSSSRGGTAPGVPGWAGGTAPGVPSWPGGTAPGVPRGASRLAPLLPGADVLWALEQALKSGQVGAVLAWLPVNLRADALRRLQLAAQAHAGPVFIFRDALARSRPSPAPLRLLLQPAGIDGLALRLIKRRGPLLAQPLRLQLPPVLPAALQAQWQARADARQISQAAAAVQAAALPDAPPANRQPSGPAAA